MKHQIAQYMDPFFNGYLAVQRGLATNTIIAYRDGLKLLFCFISDTIGEPVDRLGVEDIDEPRVVAFLNHVEEKRDCTVKTRNARLAAIRTFFHFIARQEPDLLSQCQRICTIPQKRTEQHTMEYLDEEEIRLVLDSVDVNSRTGIRDTALLLLLYNTGARVSEIVDLKISDLRLDGVGQVKLLGKGRKQRSCPIWPETVEAINTYIRHRNPKESTSERLFLNANGVPISRFGVRYVTRKYGAVAGNKSNVLKNKTVNPHTLRHTAAMHLLRAGNDINLIRRWLGHASVDTTHAYIEIDMEMKRKMIEKVEAPDVKAAQPWKQPKVLAWLESLIRPQRLCAAT